MKRREIHWAVAVLLLLGSHTAHAFDAYFLSEPDDGTFAVGTFAETRFGEITEYVFSSSDSSRDDDLYSQLDWEMWPLVLTGFEAELEVPYNFFFGGNFAAAVPMPIGEMANRDWVDGHEPLDRYDKATHYSEHDNYLIGGHAGDIYAGHRSLVFFRLTAGPMLGFKSIYIAMDGKDGQGEYPSGERDFHGSVISYRQTYSIPYAGLWVSFEPYAYLLMDLAVRGSLFTMVDAIDHHYERDLVFYDYPRGGSYLDVDLTTSYRWLDTADFFFSVGFCYIPQFTGDSQTLHTGSGLLASSSDPAGTSQMHFRASIGTRLLVELF